MTRRSNPGWSVRFASRLQDELPAMLDTAGRIVEDEARRIVYLGRPDHLDRQTGELGSSITRKVDTEGQTVTASVGTSCSYASAHEFGAAIALPSGTVAVIPARPFLEPAFVAKSAESLAAVHNRMARLLEETCP